jgi:hypothetical protein
MRQHPGVLPVNVAALVELAPGPRPKGLVWTGERVRSWQLNFEARLAAARAAGGRVDPVSIWVSAPVMSGLLNRLRCSSRPPGGTGFHMIVYLAGMPPVRLHDLRHEAATLLLAAGHRMKVVQGTLGLSSITIAADTYTSVLPQLARQSAEDGAALIHPSQIPPPRRRPGQAARPERTCRRSAPGARQAREGPS